MNRAGDHLLARARLAKDQHRQVGRGHECGPFHHVLEPSSRAHDILIDVLAAEPREKRLAVGLRGLTKRAEFVKPAVVVESDGEGFEEIAKDIDVVMGERTTR